MKKKILLFTLVSLQFVFFLWITGCRNSTPAAVPTITASAVHASDINGCFTNSCFGPPFYTTASWDAYDAGTGSLVLCYIPDTTLQTVCPTAAAKQEQTETATTQPFTPTQTLTPTPNTPTNTFTPTLSFTPSTPSSTPTPTGTPTSSSPTNTFTPTYTFTSTDTPLPTFTPTPNPICQECVDTYNEKLSEIVVETLDETVTDASFCNNSCAGFGDPEEVELCLLGCEATLDAEDQIKAASETLIATIDENNCLIENECEPLLANCINPITKSLLKEC
jgi:hypothetical protein